MTKGKKQERMVARWPLGVLALLSITLLVLIGVLGIAWTRDGWSLERAQTLGLLWIATLINVGFFVGLVVGPARNAAGGLEINLQAGYPSDQDASTSRIRWRAA